MRIPVMFADYPDWMFTGQFVVAAIAGPALLCLLIAAARMKEDRRAAHGWLVAAGIWAGGLTACVILGKIILV